MSVSEMEAPFEKVRLAEEFCEPLAHGNGSLASLDCLSGKHVYANSFNIGTYSADILHTCTQCSEFVAVRGRSGEKLGVPVANRHHPHHTA